MRERLSVFTANYASASLMIQMQRKHIWLVAVIVCLTRLVPPTSVAPLLLVLERLLID